MSALSYNPLHCMMCNLEIPITALKLDDALVQAIVGWRDVYAALDRLWLDSGAYENFALQALTDVQSPVNQRGLAVARQIGATHACYFWLFVEDVDVPTCPNCAGQWREYASPVVAQLVCDTCGIVVAR